MKNLGFYRDVKYHKELVVYVSKFVRRMNEQILKFQHHRGKKLFSKQLENFNGVFTP